VPQSQGPRSPSAASRTRWVRELEAQSLRRPDALLRTARANTRKAANDVDFLAALAQELCVTRGPELTLAYRSLVWMMPGFRRKGVGDKARVTGEICVICLVRNKGSVCAGDPQHLPRWLTLFAEHEGERKLFAVAVDVQDVGEYAQAEAHAASGIWTRNPPWAPSPGSFACLVSLVTGPNSAACVLSAQHVLNPYPDAHSLQIKSGRPVLPLDREGGLAAAPILAVTLPVGGVLRGDERPDRPSFDVQLAQLDAAGLLRESAALRNFHPERPFVRSMGELLRLDQANWFHLLTPDNHANGPRGAVRLTLQAMPPASTPFPIPYHFSEGGQAVTRRVYQAGLLSFRANDPGGKVPLRGDSGSPIVVRHADSTMTLVAMHVGGNELGLSWAIPAWQIFDVRLWRRYPAGAYLSPLDA
jgi:hypothetical protein